MAVAIKDTGERGISLPITGRGRGDSQLPGFEAADYNRL